MVQRFVNWKLPYYICRHGCHHIPNHINFADQNAYFHSSVPFGFKLLDHLCRFIFAGTAHGLEAIHSRLNLHQVARYTNLSDMLVQDEARAMSLNSRLRSDILVQPRSATISVKPGLSIGSGNYYVRIGLGTPTKYYAMLLDTGSSFSWLQCLPCQYCHPQSDPLFNPSASKSYKTILCSSPACAAVRDATLNDPACDFSSGQCIYTASYGDRSFSVRVLSQDVLSLFRLRQLRSFCTDVGMTIWDCSERRQACWALAFTDSL